MRLGEGNWAIMLIQSWHMPTSMCRELMYSWRNLRNNENAPPLKPSGPHKTETCIHRTRKALLSNLSPPAPQPRQNFATIMESVLNPMFRSVLQDRLCGKSLCTIIMQMRWDKSICYSQCRSQAQRQECHEIQTLAPLSHWYFC